MTSCPEGFRTSSRCHPGGLGRRLLSLGPGAGPSPCGPPGRDCTRSAGRLRVGSAGHQADTGPGRWPREVSSLGVSCEVGPRPEWGPVTFQGLSNGRTLVVICVLCHR